MQIPHTTSAKVTQSHDQRKKKILKPKMRMSSYQIHFIIMTAYTLSCDCLKVRLGDMHQLCLVCVCVCVLVLVCVFVSLSVYQYVYTPTSLSLRKKTGNAPGIETNSISVDKRIILMERNRGQEFPSANGVTAGSTRKFFFSLLSIKGKSRDEVRPHRQGFLLS